MKQNKSYPLLPLRDMVVFPGNVASLFVGREKSMEATRLAMDGNRMLVLSAQKNTETILPELSDLHSVAVLCEILQLLKMPDGTYKILVEGLSRVQIENFFDHDNYLETEVSPLYSLPVPEEEVQEKLFEKLHLEIQGKLDKLSLNQKSLTPELLQDLGRKKDSELFLDTVAHIINLAFAQKQDILATLPLLERAEKISLALDSLLEIQNLENSIQEKVREQMDKMQRNYYLNEQMKVIREELGETEPDELETYKNRLKEKSMPEEARQRAEQEIKKLEKMPPMSAESGVVRNYLDWLLDLPWNDASRENDSILAAKEILENSHHGLEKVKERILEFVAVKQLAPASRGPILCLAGPPGVGKTSMAEALADCLNRKFARISLGGVRDEAEIRGHRRTYIGALPGRIISTLKRLKVNNPVILLDEIDKISSDYRGNPAAALLEVLDPQQNREFTDHYLEIPFDLSQVLFLTTANVTHSIPEALLDRLEIINLSGYTELEKISITRKYLLPRQLKENGIDQADLKYSLKSLAYIIRHYTREAGVRQLEQQIAAICRKIAREYLEARQSENSQLAAELLNLPLDKKNIHRFLGAPRYNYGKKEKEVVIGKCNGLAWTNAGGDVLNIETALAHGSGKFILTGNLGEVMKESGSTALGYVRSQAHLLGLPDDFFDKNDIFVHVPEGAIPKDGPSAGITIATSLISAVTQTAIKNEVAMTGEITLRGMVLPIGGLKEKTLAAFRGGITEIICPQENEKDLEEIPLSVREKITFHFVSNMKQVISLALVGADIFQDKPGKYSFYSSHLPAWPEPAARVPEV